MKLATHGIEGQGTHGDSFHNTRFREIKAYDILSSALFPLSDRRCGCFREGKRWAQPYPRKFHEHIGARSLWELDT
jgi:hypothetical protein